MSNKKQILRWKKVEIFFIVLLAASAALVLVYGSRNYFLIHDPYEIYYRLIVDLRDKQGRKIGVDIVVGCGVHRGAIMGGGRTFDVMDMDAAVYAWAIPDGHALSIRTSPAIAAVDTCSGATTDNGRIPHDWLPFIIWYDDASDLSHGLGYATQDAYTNQRSQLEFAGARVIRATSAEYRAFKANAPPNLLPRHLSDVRIDYTGSKIIQGGAEITNEMIASPKRAWKISDWLTCRGLIKSSLPTNLKDDISKLRPISADKYWTYGKPLPPAINQNLQRGDETYSGGYMKPASPEWDAKRPKVYLQTFDGDLDRLNPATFADGTYRKDTQVIPENLGFMNCGRPAPLRLVSAVTGRHLTLADSSRITCFIDGIQIGETGQCTSTTEAFEYNDYFFNHTRQLQD